MTIIHNIRFKIFHPNLGSFQKPMNLFSEGGGWVDAPLRKPTVSHEKIKQRTKIGKLNSVIYVFQRQCQVNRIAGPLPGAWILCNLLAISQGLFFSSHIPALFFLSGPNTAFQKFENAFSMRENAVSDAYGWYDLQLLNSLWWKKSEHIIFDFRARIISAVSVRHAI